MAEHVTLRPRPDGADSVEAEAESLSTEVVKGMGALVTGAGRSAERAMEAEAAMEALEMTAVSFQAEAAARCKR